MNIKKKHQELIDEMKEATDCYIEHNQSCEIIISIEDSECEKYLFVSINTFLFERGYEKDWFDVQDYRYNYDDKWCLVNKNEYNFYISNNLEVGKSVLLEICSNVSLGGGYRFEGKIKDIIENSNIGLEIGWL